MTEKREDVEDGVLDETVFRHFTPLLHASQSYAALSGCRFRSKSFDGLPKEASDGITIPASISAARARDPGPRLSAKLRASPVVAEFEARLLAKEPGLIEEVERAFRIVMTESVRNAMQGMLQALDMFPPSPPPRGVEDDDCAYEDVTAPLPVVAQRLYNDKVRRISDIHGAGKLQKRAMTAAFIVDFAEVTGVELPPLPDTHRDMLQELAARTAEETKRRGKSEAETNRIREVFLRGLGDHVIGERMRVQARQWWAENWKAVAVTAAAGLAFGLFGVAAAVLTKAGRQPPLQERTTESEQQQQQ